MKKLPQSQIDLTIETLAFGGAGVGRIEMPQAPTPSAIPTPGVKKMAVFVEGTVPGDRVKVRIGGRKRNYLIGYIDEFIEKAPQRVAPFCRHFCNGNNLHCGGCSMQFLSYPDQLKIKEQHVRDSIKRIGNFEESIVLPIIGCENPLYYRNKMEFSFSRMGKNSAHDDETYLTLGQHIRRRHHDLAEIEECFLMETWVGELVTGLRKLFRALDEKKLLPPEMELKSLIIRNSKYSGETMINLVADNSGYGGPEGENLPEFISEFKNHCLDFFSGLTSAGSSEKQSPPPQLTSIFFTDIINKKGQSKKYFEHLLHGSPTITETMKRPDGTSLHFRISPQSFFQPNTLQAEVLYGEAIKAAGLTGGETVFDLYCGAGTIGIFCANRAKKIYGIEINKDAIKNAVQNAKDNGIDNIEFFCGDTEKELAAQTAGTAQSAKTAQAANLSPTTETGQTTESTQATNPAIAGAPAQTFGTLPRPDLIILDPPRNGLEPGALKKIASFRAPKIVYVSCNPTTQARDLRLFASHGYKLLSIRPVDMFPHTYHIESVAALQLE